ncbi:MAG: diguanylate cyclase [Nitrosomonadales bacterium]|nr:diguanylate cyclase [Nitrosomonadales bacterium]
MSVPDIDPDFPAAVWPAHWQELQQKNTLVFETRHRRKDGSIFPVEVSANFVKFGGKEFNIAFSRDISERKLAEVALRIASTAFESQESMVITDADGVILRVNQAFTEATGYAAEEAVGQTPRLLKSGRHNAGFYSEMWETLQRTGKWQGEIWDRRKNGEIYPKLLTISAVKGDGGVVTHYVGADHGITERKAAEEEINNLAFYDSLTQLPNRRLLDDRLGKTIAASRRSGRYGALMFLDLDNFKPLNDLHGHSVGDLLLVEVARRIARCVREVDTVARFGGDEFVVVLSELDEDKAESASQTGNVAGKIRATLNEPFVLKIQAEGKAERTVEHHCTSSIGVVLFTNHEAGASDILKWADMAMYQAKEAGRNQIRFYEPKV